MINLRLIECTPKYQRYLKAFNNAVINYLTNNDRKLLRQAVLYGVKYVSFHRYKKKNKITFEEVQEHFQIIETIRLFMMQLTPNEILNLFPITKDFDGWKYECKDYFYTVEKLNEYNPDSPLGNRLEDFLWDYVNDYTGDFIIDMMSTASDLRKFQGKPCFLEEWAEQNGISTLTVNERDGYIMDNQTNRTMPYHKPIPEYMTVVK